MTEGAPAPIIAGTLGVIGAGTMGAGIAQVALEAGWQVRIHDALPGATTRGVERIADGLQRSAAKRQMTGSAAAAWVAGALARLRIEPNPAAVAASADLVVEAIVEEIAAKRALFSELDRAAPPTTILATNTSALSVGAIASAASLHPERVLGLHFFNPAPVLRLVEVVGGQGTDPVLLDRASMIVSSWEKTPVRSTDSPGFIVNRVNRPFTIEALRMVEAGSAHPGEIDLAMRADGFRMGPFELMDLVGLDVNLAAATGVWEGLGRPDRLRPSPIQTWMVQRGRLGRKTGIGFYRYDNGLDPVPEPLPKAVGPYVPAGRSLPAEAIVWRIRSGIASEAILARDGGVASEADIDTALWLGAAHPEGPFAWLRRHDPTIHP